MRLQDIVSYKFLLILDFSLIFLFLVYSGDSYTTLKLWLKPTIEHRVEITTVPRYHADVAAELIAKLQGEELLVFADGFIAHVSLVSHKRAIVHFAAGAVTEIRSHAELLAEDIALVIDPTDEMYNHWLTKYRTQGDAVIF